MSGSKGIYHNLHEIFEQLNGVYFEGEIKADIVWGKKPMASAKRTRTSIQLGSYHPTKKLIIIHPFLDQAQVPKICVERIVYHEMLHQKYPARKERGKRRSIHTPDFKAAESLYLHARRADHWFSDNLESLLLKNLKFTS